MRGRERGRVRGRGRGGGSSRPAPPFPLRRKILAQGGSLLVSVYLVLVVLATCFCWPTYPSGKWKVVPMGAKNGNAAFQRMMEDLLGPVRDFADPFLDDIIIGSGTEDMTEDELIEAHEKDLRRVLSELDKHNMVCKPTKASLFVREVEFAGHAVGQGQRHPMPGKLASLHHWEKPQTISEL